MQQHAEHTRIMLRVSGMGGDDPQANPSAYTLPPGSEAETPTVFFNTTGAKKSHSHLHVVLLDVSEGLEAYPLRRQTKTDIKNKRYVVDPL